jgi:maleylacetate reductase
VIVRWGLGELGRLLRELGIREPLLVTTPRWGGLDVPVARRFTDVRSHVPLDVVAAAHDASRGADALVPVGGGSAIDTAKAVSARTELPVVSVPTTYAGAEWAPSFGTRDEERRVKGGGSGAHLAAIVYEPRLTLGLPRSETGGTALNALAHCAEALYARTRREEGDAHALAGARSISEWLPRVLADGQDLEARTRLLEGAAEAGAALAASGLALGHAMAQALGGRYGLPHGALNAICLPAALRFNEPVVGKELAALSEAVGGPAAERAQELARLAGHERLRDLGVPEEELGAVAEAVVVRPGARSNPREASPAEVAQLLRSIW